MYAIVSSTETNQMNKRKGSSSGGSRKKGSHAISLIYFLGFSATEITEIKKKAHREVDYAEQLTSDVTHIVFNERAVVAEVPISKLYFAAISGSWLIRPEWLLSDSPEDNYALATNNLDYIFSKAGSICIPQEIVKLCEFYATSKKQIFQNPIFSKVLFLQSSHDNEDLKCDIRSILEVSGASLVPSTTITRKMTLKGKNDHNVSIAVTFTKDAVNLNKSLLRILLEDGVPVIHYNNLLDYVKQKREPRQNELLEISDSLWSSENLSYIQVTSSKPSMMSTTECDTANRSHQNSARCFFLPETIETWLPCKSVFASWMEYMNVTPQYTDIIKSLKEHDKKTYFQSVESLNNFSQIISEYQLNTKEEEVSDLICYSAVSYLTNSDNPLFLPTPTAVSFLFHKVVMGECSELLDTKTTAFTYIKSLIQKYPPHDYESRMYWVQALASISKNSEDDFKVSECDVKKILREIRHLLEKVFQKDPIDENVVAILLDIFEIDLYYFECGGEIRGPNQLFTGKSFKNLELLATNPLAYLIVDDLGYTYGIGLDKGSKEFLMAMSKMVASHEYVSRYIRSVTRLHIVFLEAIYFTRQRGENEATIRDDLSSVIRRMINHDVARDSLQEFYPIQWIHNILHTIR